MKKDLFRLLNIVTCIMLVFILTRCVHSMNRFFSLKISHKCIKMLGRSISLGKFGYYSCV